MAVENLSEFDPFSIFGLPLSFNISLKDLDEKYFVMQKKFHPDLLCEKSLNNYSDCINFAYKTLKDPLLRLKSLVTSLGGTLEKKLSFEFLENCLDDSMDAKKEYDLRLKTLEKSNLSLDELETICAEMNYLNRRIVKNNTAVNK